MGLVGVFNVLDDACKDARLEFALFVLLRQVLLAEPALRQKRAEPFGNART